MKHQNSISNFQKKLNCDIPNLETARKMAAYLAHPFLNLPGNPSSFNQNEINLIYKFLRKNRVIFRTINSGALTTDLLTKKEFIQEVIQKHGLFTQAYNFVCCLRQKIVEVAKAMTKGGLGIIFIKAVNDFPMDSHNFDILIKEQELDKAKEILEKLGFKEMGRLQEPFKWFYRRVDNDIVISVHLHTRVAWVGIEFIDSHDLWNRQRKIEIDDVKVGFPSLEHCLLITVAHAFFENQCLKLCDLMDMTEVLQSAESLDWNYITEWGVQDLWFKAFYAFLRLANHAYKSFYGESLIEDKIFEILEEKGHVNGDRSAEKIIKQFEKKKALPVKLPVKIVAFSFFNKVFKSSNMSFLGKIRKVSSVGWGYAAYRMPLRREFPAFLICFSGQDGTGKTTYAEFLYKDLMKTIKVMNDDIMEKNIRITYVWSRGIGLLFYPLLQTVKLLLQGGRSNSLSGNNPLSASEPEREKLLRLKPIKILWKYTTLLDELLQLTLRVRIPLLLRQQQTVICDRYIYDTLIDVECGLGQNVGWVLEKMATDLSPQPAIGFILDAEPADLVRRKKGLKCEMLECKRKEYLAFSADKKLVVIDTRKDLQQNRKEILLKVLETMLI